MIQNSVASEEGGGAYVATTGSNTFELIVKSTTFIGNNATGQYKSGGGFYFYSQKPENTN